MKTLRYAALIGAALLLGSHPARSETTPTTPATTAPEATAAPAPTVTTPPVADPEEAVVDRLKADVAATELVELDVAGKKVLALQRKETRGQAEGGLILLHDVGAHADWEEVIGTLRRELNQYGWTTLAVQLPVPAVGTQASAYGPLIEQCQQRTSAALKHIKGQGLRNVVILGHGLGGRCATSFAASQKDPALRGLILVGMEAYTTLDPPQDSTALLAQVRVPIYDLYGYGDSNEVHRAGTERLALGRRLNRQHAEEEARYREHPFYRQFVQDGADHFFSAQQALLVKRVYGWLKTHASGMERDNK